jgi:FkbM family methyltransferase
MLSTIMRMAVSRGIPGSCQLAQRLHTDTIMPVTLPDGTVLTLDPCHPAQRGMMTGLFEADEQALFASYVRPVSTVLDIGAHIGFHTVALARAAGPQGHVYAFEPFPANRTLLTTNVERNWPDRVTVLDVAMSDEIGTASFFVPTGYSTSMLGSLERHVRSTAGAAINVPTMTVDAFCQQRGLRDISFIKIDVEGSELRVLAGMTATMRDCRPVVACEITPDRWEDASVMAQLLNDIRALGYDAMLIDGDRLRPATEQQAGNYVFVPQQIEQHVPVI